MICRSLLALLVAFILALSLISYKTADVKARFVCNYDGSVTRVVAINKKVDSLQKLQEEIACFLPDKTPASFSIKYELPDQTPRGGTLYGNLIDVASDEDVRNLMAEYDALARASPYYPVLFLRSVVTWDWLFMTTPLGSLLAISLLCCGFGVLAKLR